jgi:hypothetical protein
MKIQRIMSEHRNDFTADMVCEHCGAVYHNDSGYHDNWYHTKVIPAMYCRSCGKNRAGETEPQPTEERPC